MDNLCILIIAQNRKKRKRIAPSDGKYSRATRWTRTHQNANADAPRCSCGDANCNNVAKHPLTTNGVKDATNDPEQLKAFFLANTKSPILLLLAANRQASSFLDEDDRHDASRSRSGLRDATEDTDSGDGWRWTPSLLPL